MKDFNKLKIVMSDEDVAQTLLRIQELKEELARLKQEAMDNALGFTIDTNFAETLEEAKQLRDDLKTYQTTGREFVSMEAAQVASMRLADLTQQINEYLLSLDPAQQKMAEFTAALSEVESLKSKQDSGQSLTADETRRYEEASATVERYTNDIVSLIVHPEQCFCL
jgi:chaperonin cofactor prefoldin